MTISKRVLTKWRKEALKANQEKECILDMYKGVSTHLSKAYLLCIERILQLTQELIDQELLKETKNG